MGLSRPLEPLAGLGDVPLHLHRTMHERLAVRSPIRVAFLFPRYPHEDFIQTTSWRRLHRDQRKGAFALPLLGTIPSTNEPSSPLEP